MKRESTSGGGGLIHRLFAFFELPGAPSFRSFIAKGWRPPPSLPGNLSLRRRDPFADSRQRSSAVKNQVAILDADPELLPQAVKIDELRFLPHVVVERGQHSGPGGTISHCEHLGDRPFLIDRPPGRNNADRKSTRLNSSHLGIS